MLDPYLVDGLPLHKSRLIIVASPGHLEI
jgi:hypothetical protein